MKLRIGIDTDGVLRDLNRKIAEVFSEHNSNYKIKDMESYANPFDMLPLPYKDAEQFVREHRKEIYENALPLRDCHKVSCFEKLLNWAKAKGHKLICVTNQQEINIPSTNIWLGKYGFLFTEIHYTGNDINKLASRADVILDDYEPNLRHFKEDDKLAICFNRQYNKLTPKILDIKSVTNLTEIIPIIEEYIREQNIRKSK